MHIHETKMAKKLFGQLGYALQNRIANRVAIILKNDSSSTLFQENTIQYMSCKRKKKDILRISDHELRVYSHNWSHVVNLFPYVNHDHFVLIRSLILVQS